MLDNSKIKARLDVLRSELSDNHRKTREDIIEDLTDVINQFKITGNFTGHTLKAIEILNKMMGWNEPEKSEVTHKGLTVNYIKPKNKKDEDK